MRSHDLEPWCVFGAMQPDWTARSIPDGGGTLWRGTTLQALMADPKPRDPLWMPSTGARLAVASTGPVLVAAEGALSARCEVARWPRVAPDADLNAAREAFWPTLKDLQRLAIGAGSPAPALVAVGERDPHDRMPFFARSGNWFFRALRTLGWDELQVYATNALNFKQHHQTSELSELEALFARYEPVWVAVGSVAHEILTTAKIEHITVQHPAQHKRFKFKDGPDGYASDCRAAGLPMGPWSSKPLPVSQGFPTLVEAVGLPLSVAYKKFGATGRKGAAAVHFDEAEIEKARTLFVVGEAQTIKEAAASVKPGSRSFREACNQAAERGGWVDEKTKHLERRREAAKSASVEFEAKAMTQSRKLAWSALPLALAKLVNQLRGQNNQTPIRAQDVKALGELATRLSDTGDLASDAERERIKSLPPQDLLKELKTTVDQMFGDEKEKT